MNTVEDLMSGFTRIEVSDVRVGRVDIPFETFGKIRTRLGGSFDPADRWLTPLAQKNRKVGTIWGADVYLGGKDVIVKPEGWAEGRRWVSSWGKEHVVRPVIVEGSCLRELWDIGKLTIFVKSHCDPILNVSGPENVALESLRESLTEDEYRKYLKNGFLCVRGASGRVYQIPRGHNGYGHVMVWERGKKIAEICSYILDRKMPPTDRVIAFKAIIEADEQEMWRRGNVFNMRTQAA